SPTVWDQGQKSLRPICRLSGPPADGSAAPAKSPPSPAPIYYKTGADRPACPHTLSGSLLSTLGSSRQSLFVKLSRSSCCPSCRSLSTDSMTSCQSCLKEIRPSAPFSLNV